MIVHRAAIVVHRNGEFAVDGSDVGIGIDGDRGIGGQRNINIALVRPEGLEPPPFGLEDT